MEFETEAESVLISDETSNSSNSVNNEEKDINVLLLSGRGFGKSTFINAFRNYLEHTDFEKAEKQKLLVMVPQRITITDKDNRDHDVTVGVLDLSKSRKITTSLIPLPSRNVKLHMTNIPALEQSEEQDEKFYDTILSYIKQLKEIHAVCCIFSATNPAIDDFFECCFKKLLPSLGKEISRNLIFIFTGSHATHYKPGKTLMAFKKLLGQSKISDELGEIPLENANIFCFENDSYCYLASIKQMVEFDDDLRMCYKETWDHSSKETQRLIEYILGSNSNKALEQFSMSQVVSKAQKDNISSVAPLLFPMCDILELIMKNHQALVKHRKSWLQCKITGDDVKLYLYIPQIDMKVIKLSKPATFCASKDCALPYDVFGIKCYHNIQRCCDPCYLMNVVGLVGTTTLSDCEEMDNSGVCKQCGCRVSNHMHCYYSTKLTLKKADFVLLPNINVHLQSLHTLNTLNVHQQSLNTLNDNIANFRKEYEIIIKHLAELACFLEKNANLSYDPVEVYANYLNQRDGNCNEENWSSYFLKDYLAAKSSSNEITYGTIQNSMNELYSLALTGEKMRELVDSLNIPHKKEMEHFSKTEEPSPKNTSVTTQNQKIKNNESPFQIITGNDTTIRNVNSHARHQNGNGYNPNHSHLAYGHTASFHNQHMGFHNQPMSSHDQPMSSHDQPMSFHDQPMAFQGRSMSFHDQPNSHPSERQIPFIKCGNPYCRNPQCIGYINAQSLMPQSYDQQSYHGNVGESGSDCEDAEDEVEEMNEKDIKFFENFRSLKGLRINEEKEINILLLGGTGIGKSTFINALANYLSYKTMKNAEEEKLMVLIPSHFPIMDKYFVDHDIVVGSDDNECLEVGSSATQGVKTYVFPIGSGKTKLRIIDSPGVCDTRGPTQDKINCENILSYLGNIEKLHAICCMFSTTNARITVAFDYCFKEILSRLDKSASNNLVFIFTNARAAHYTPGETLPILRKLAADIQRNPPYVKIPLNRENMFCFENDCFKYLAARKQNVEFDDDVVEFYNDSWRQSSIECWRMIAYIIGDSTRTPLVPHDTRNTISVNEARRLIIHLSMPLADISQNIQDNIMVLDRHKKYLQTHNLSIEDMKKKLYIPLINLEVTTLKEPVTVCANNTCTEVYSVKDVKKWHYKQRCHDPCYLQNVPKEIIGTPELINCAAMDRSTGKCIKCGCDFTAHMHVYYMTITVDDKIEDESVKNNLLTNEEARKKTKRLINDIENRKDAFEKERKKITEYTAQFAHFLQNNAIAPYNDSYENYIKYMIEREQMLGQNADHRVIKQMQDLLREYQEIKRSYEVALSCKDEGNMNDLQSVTSESILKSVNELYNLPHTGKKIKDMVESQKAARSGEYRSTNEYVHPSPENMFADLTKEEFSQTRRAKKQAKKKGSANNPSIWKRTKEGLQYTYSYVLGQPSQQRSQQQRGRQQRGPIFYL